MTETLLYSRQPKSPQQTDFLYVTAFMCLPQTCTGHLSLYILACAVSQFKIAKWLAICDELISFCL